MSGLTDYTESALGNALLKGATYNGGAVYIGLFVGDPTDTETPGQEITDSSYSRQVAHDSVVSDGFTEGPVGTFKNNHLKDFPAIADATLTITHAGVFNAAVDGDLIMYGALANGGKQYEIGDIPRFAPNQIVFVID